MGIEAATILLVEDEAAHAFLTERAIRKAGHANRIDIVPDGEQALDYLFHRGRYADQAEYPRPALVLLDIKLPGLDGIEVLRQVKTDLILRQVPVIILTTSEREQDITACQQHHADSYLTKPVGAKEFAEKIRQFDSCRLLVNAPPI
jgi:CheY-like chemotaxis protein